jgi:PiT family inorganic phosphate transporter
MTPLLIAVIVCAVGFAFVNGFHDTANAIATTVYTRALGVGAAIALAAVMNFVGTLVSQNVAKTITNGIVMPGVLVAGSGAERVILATLIAALIWSLFTWWRAIPCSSSHALIGGLIGATLVFTLGLGGINWVGVLEKVVLPLFTSPLIGFFVGFLLMKLIFGLFARMQRPHANKLFLRLQILSAAFVAFAHGTNDSQKAMGIMTLALVAGGVQGADAPIPFWVTLLCAVTLAAGTSIGGWRVMKTVGSGVTKLNPANGFAAQTASALTIEAMSLVGAPISTTQVITCAVMGAGSARRLRSVKWATAKSIVWTWVITLPVAAVLGAAAMALVGLF